MKKLNILICILMMIFSLTACGNTVEEPESITTAAPTTVLTTAPTTVLTTAPTTALTTVPTTVITAAPTNTTIPESSSITTTQASTTVVSLPVITSETTTSYTATETTTTKHTTTKQQTTTEATTAKPTTTKQTTSKVTTTKPVTTTKSTTVKVITKPVTTTKPSTRVQTTASAKKYCTVRIECSTIYNNIGKLKSGKKNFLPTNGVILNNVKVELNGGESAFDVIKKACEENVCTDNCKYCKASGVQIEYTYTPAFNNYYIEGIHQIYEKDCGTQSGWMYSVNGVFPDVGTSSYTVSPGDVIVFSFTCNMGEDIGNSY